MLRGSEFHNISLEGLLLEPALSKVCIEEDSFSEIGTVTIRVWIGDLAAIPSGENAAFCLTITRLVSA